MPNLFAYPRRHDPGGGWFPAAQMGFLGGCLMSRRAIDAGVEAFHTRVNPKKFPRSFAGRKLDHAFLNDLPEGVDPCGENGEFLTCVRAGPMFRRPVPATVGEIVERDGFHLVDPALGVAMMEA